VTDFTRDLTIVEAVAADLKPYLLSDALYWPLHTSHPGRTPLPNGTLGAMLMLLHQLDCLRASLSPDQAYRLEQATSRAEAELGHWAAQAEAKASLEARARARAWHTYAAEAETTPDQAADDYPQQARGRTILALLQVRFSGVFRGASFTGQVTLADQRLREITWPAPFVLDPALEPAYPAEHYWWLYRRPGRG